MKAYIHDYPWGGYEIGYNKAMDDSLEVDVDPSFIARCRAADKEYHYLQEELQKLHDDASNHPRRTS